MDIERLIRLAVSGDFTVNREIKAEAKRKNDPFLKCFCDILHINNTSKEDLTGPRYSTKSSYGGIISKYANTFRSMSLEEIDYLDQISSLLVPVYKRKFKGTSTSLPSPTILRLCRHRSISNGPQFKHLLDMDRVDYEVALTATSNTLLWKTDGCSLMSKLGKLVYLDTGDMYRSGESLRETGFLTNLHTLKQMHSYAEESLRVPEQTRLGKVLSHVKSIRRLVISNYSLAKIPSDTEIDSLYIDSLYRLDNLSNAIKIKNLVINCLPAYVDREYNHIKKLLSTNHFHRIENIFISQNGEYLKFEMCSPKFYQFIGSWKENHRYWGGWDD